MVFSLISEGKLCQESFGRKIHLIQLHLNKSDYNLPALFSRNQNLYLRQKMTHQNYFPPPA